MTFAAFNTLVRPGSPRLPQSRPGFHACPSPRRTSGEEMASFGRPDTVAENQGSLTQTSHLRAAWHAGNWVRFVKTLRPSRRPSPIPSVPKGNWVRFVKTLQPSPRPSPIPSVPKGNWVRFVKTLRPSGRPSPIPSVPKGNWVRFVKTLRPSPRPSPIPSVQEEGSCLAEHSPSALRSNKGMDPVIELDGLEVR